MDSNSQIHHIGFLEETNRGNTYLLAHKLQIGKRVVNEIFEDTFETVTKYHGWHFRIKSKLKKKRLEYRQYL